MSYQKLRDETNCLNCGHEVTGRYCPNCGQENLPIHDSTLHLILHYIQDLFHYDGKLWHTVVNLIRRPGQVAVEYLEGKRKKNIEPIKFYVFASTVFFILFFIRIHPGENEDTAEAPSKTSRLYHLKEELRQVKGTADTLLVQQLIASLAAQGDSLNVDSILYAGDDLQIDIFGHSAQDTTKTKGFEAWLESRIEKKQKALRKEHNGDNVRATVAFFNELLHKLPQLLFISMPFFAVLLKLLYFRNFRRRYVEHFIFTTYLYGFLFVLFTIYLLYLTGLDTFHLKDESALFSFIGLGFSLFPFGYLMASMKRFYKDRWGWVVLRFILLMSIFSVTLILLFVLLAFVAFLL